MVCVCARKGEGVELKCVCAHEGEGGGAQGVQTLKF